MNYDEALTYLGGLPSFGSKPGLERMGRVMEALGNPHRGPGWIHVAGTNGKGSVCAMIESILREAGYVTGLYISPHLESFQERISVNSSNITREDVARLVTDVSQIAGTFDEPLTHFELITAMCFRYFKERAVQLGVLEVGLGGRLDATNIIEAPLVAVITPVGLDHTDRLGRTVAEIAREKAGIIKRGSAVVCAPQLPEAARVLREVCALNGCRLTDAMEAVEWRELEFGLSGQELEIVTSRRRLPRVRIPLLGRHQQQNTATAVAAVDVLDQLGFAIDDNSVVLGLERTRWPGRLEILRANPYVVLDGAHNPAAARVLSEAIKDLFPGRRLILLIGMLADKAVDEVISQLVPLAETVVVTSPPSSRALPAERLAEHVRSVSHKVIVQDGVDRAIDAALGMLGARDVLCITGSLYLVGEARRCLLGSGVKT